MLMLARRAQYARMVICRAYSSAPALCTVPTLPDASLETFRSHAFQLQLPALLPRGAFSALPATSKWFAEASGRRVLNRTYLAPFGSAIVPLEFSNDSHFTRSDQSLSFFLECVEASSSTYTKQSNRYFSSYVPGARAVKRTKKDNDFFSASKITKTKQNKAKPTARIYLAQAPISNLPQGLRDDLPSPEVVLRAGKGDVYDSSIWLGEAPTYTPLHRDPNPNLFVQLAGKKIVRLFKPEVGKRIFAKVQEQIGGAASASLRGEEMMAGAEKKALEQEVWDESDNEFRNAAWEAELEAGDGLFIPKGWWHSVKGIGEGMTGSVCFVVLRFWVTTLTDDVAGQLVVSMNQSDADLWPQPQSTSHRARQCRDLTFSDRQHRPASQCQVYETPEHIVAPTCSPGSSIPSLRRRYFVHLLSSSSLSDLCESTS